MPPCGEAEFSTPWPDTRGPWKVSSVADTAGHILLGPTHVCVPPGKSPGLWGRLPWALPSGFHSALPFCALSSHPERPPPRPAELRPGSHGTHGISPLSASSPPLPSPRWSIPGLGSLGPSPSTLTSGVWPGPAFPPSNAARGGGLIPRPTLVPSVVGSTVPTTPDS